MSPENTNPPSDESAEQSIEQPIPKSSMHKQLYGETETPPPISARRWLGMTLLLIVVGILAITSGDLFKAKDSAEEPAPTAPLNSSPDQ